LKSGVLHKIQRFDSLLHFVRSNNLLDKEIKFTVALNRQSQKTHIFYIFIEYFAAGDLQRVSESRKREKFYSSDFILSGVPQLMDKSKFQILSYVILFSFVFILSHRAMAQDKYEIKNVLTEGRYTLQQDNHLSLAITCDGVSTVTLTVFQVSWNMTVLPLQKGEELQEAVLQAHRIVCRSEQGNEKVYYDNTNKIAANETLNKLYQPYLDTQIHCFIDKQGKVQKVEGIDELQASLNDLIKQDSTLSPEDIKNPLTEQFFKELIGTLNNSCSPEPVAVGEEWNTEQDIDIPVYGTKTLSITNKLESVRPTPRHKVARVKSNASLSLDEINGKVTNESTSTYDVDRQLCTEYSSNSRIDISQEISYNDTTSIITTIGILKHKLNLIKKQ